MTFVMGLAIFMFLLTCILNAIEFFKGEKIEIAEFFEFMNLICFSLFTKSVYASENTAPWLAEFGKTTLFQTLLVTYLVICIAFIAIRFRKKRK